MGVRVVTQEPSRFRRPPGGLDVDRAWGDLKHLDRSSARSPGADVVFHAAGFISISPGDEQRLQHRQRHRHGAVLTAAVAAKVSRLVHVSSVHALAPFPQDSQVDEFGRGADTTDAPAYDRSKATGERLVAWPPHAGSTRSW